MIVSSFPSVRKIIKISEQQYQELVCGINNKDTHLKNNEKQFLITKKWSVADEVDNAVDVVYDGIKNTLSTSKAKYLYPQLIQYRNITNITLFGNSIELRYTVYNLMDDNAAKYINQLELNNSFSETDKVLFVSVIAVCWDIVENFSTTSIAHEIEHIYQFFKSQENNPNFQSLVNAAYKYSVSVLNKPNSNIYQRHLANIFYYSNYREQDAFVTEYYEEIKYDKTLLNELENSEIYQRLSVFKNSIQFFRSNINNSQMTVAINEYKIFGYTTKNIELMINKALKRFMKKIKNVEKHFKNTVTPFKKTFTECDVQKIVNHFKQLRD